MDAGDWFNELTIFKEGLKQHAEHSNLYVIDWMNNINDKLSLRNVNCISLDFASARLTKRMIQYNDEFVRGKDEERKESIQNN
mmetsp:Transcript_41332/g.30385  ORF Transcript_41332/g.30385 Transcript_41332/m.30385 type:complete len:83 (+) Transcript_41332:841-1089(+)